MPENYFLEEEKEIFSSISELPKQAFYGEHYTITYIISFLPIFYAQQNIRLRKNMVELMRIVEFAK